MSVWEVIVVYGVVPALVVAILAVLTVGVGRQHAKTRYEPGQPWDRPDRLWAGDVPVISLPAADRVGTARGGAHANW